MVPIIIILILVIKDTLKKDKVSEGVGDNISQKTLATSSFWDNLLKDMYFMLTLMVASTPASMVHILASANSCAIMMLQNFKKL
jgi:hypothetical protein